MRGIIQIWMIQIQLCACFVRGQELATGGLSLDQLPATGLESYKQKFQPQISLFFFFEHESIPSRV